MSRHILKILSWFGSTRRLIFSKICRNLSNIKRRGRNGSDYALVFSLKLIGSCYYFFVKKVKSSQLYPYFPILSRMMPRIIALNRGEFIALK